MPPSNRGTQRPGPSQRPWPGLRHKRRTSSPRSRGRHLLSTAPGGLNVLAHPNASPLPRRSDRPVAPLPRRAGCGTSEKPAPETSGVGDAISSTPVPSHHVPLSPRRWKDALEQPDLRSGTGSPVAEDRSALRPLHQIKLGRPPLRVPGYRRRTRNPVLLRGDMTLDIPLPVRRCSAANPFIGTCDG